MGSKSAPSAPAAPDPVATAAAQSASNAQTAKLQAELNRVNTYTPYGSIVYTQVPGTAPTTTGGTTTGGGGIPGRPSGRPDTRSGYQYTPGSNTWRADVTLSPEQQAILDLQEEGRTKYGQIGNQALDRVGRIMGTDIDFSGLPQINDGVTDRQRVEDALFGRLNPQLSMQREALDTRLRNQGLTPGSDAWNNSWREYSMTENDARLATIGAAGQEQQRLFGMSTADRQRAMNEMLAQRQIPLNEAAALMQGAQVQYPQFPNVAQAGVQPTDVAGITQNAYQNQMAAYNAQMQQQSGLFGGLAQLGGAGISAALPYMFTASDERLKENISRVGETDDGLNIYLFNYKGNARPQVGVMAQEVEKRDPGAVREFDGFKAVDLERALLAKRGRNGKGVRHHA